MKKKMKWIVAAMTLTALVLGGCGSGISQDEYDKVVAERDDLQKEYDELLEEYAQMRLENKKREVEESVGEKEAEKNENLPDSQDEGPYFSYSGNGDDVVSGTSTEDISYAHIVHNGDGHFSVKGHYGETYDLLVNTTEPYDGITLIYPNQEYTFEVSAKGDWTIELFKVGTSSKDEFSGSGDFVTPIFIGTSQTYNIITNGSGHFAVKGWTDDGYDLLVNTTEENYSGKVMFKNGGGYAFFEITASREWEIKPVE